MEIADHKIIVVGGSSGMGLGVVRAALAKGAEVTIVGRSKDRLDGVSQELEAGSRAQSVVADVTREDDVRRLFEIVGRFDHLVVTAAADLAYQPIRELNIDAARRTIDSKFVAALLLAKHAAAHIDPHGSITLTAGVAAERPLPNGVVVAAVNGALFSLTYGLAIALAPIRVNVLSPGWVDTQIWDAIAGDNKPAVLGQMARRLPAARIGLPEDIAHAALFLMENEFTTGIILPVDGGHRLV